MKFHLTYFDNKSTFSHFVDYNMEKLMKCNGKQRDFLDSTCREPNKLFATFLGPTTTCLNRFVRVYSAMAFVFAKFYLPLYKE